MSKTIFQHIANVTYLKKDPATYSESDWKSYSPYMMNRWLSMCKDLTGVIDQTQKYYTLDKQLHYRMLMNILPKSKIFTRYIKGKSTKKFNADLVNVLSSHYEVSKTEVKSYLELGTKDKILTLHIRNILERYGKSDKEIQKLMSTIK